MDYCYYYTILLLLFYLDVYRNKEKKDADVC